MDASFDMLRAYAADDVVARGTGVGEAVGSRSARDFLHDIARVTRRLRGCSGEVLVVCDDRYHLAVAVLAGWEAGLVVALPPNTREGTLRELAGRAGCVLHDHELGAGWQGADSSGVAADRGAVASAVPRSVDLRVWLTDPLDAGPPLSPIPATRRLATLYTSGSGGDHAACAKTAQQLLGEAALHARSLGWNRGTRVLATVPAHHIYGLLWSVLAPLAAGASFVRETPLQPRVVEHVAQRTRANLLISVPAHLHALAEAAHESLGGVTSVFSSGAALPAATAQRLHARFGVTVTEVLGSTETGGIAVRPAHEPNASWRALPGLAVTRNEAGLMCLGSPLLAADLPQPFICADRIELEPDGGFRHAGRVDDVIKVAGTRVSLSELQARVLSLAGVTDAAAISVEVAQARGQEIWLAVASANPELELAQLRAQLLRWYDPVALPRRLRVVAALPREPTGKLPRGVFLALFDAVAPEPQRRVDFEIREREALRAQADREICAMRVRVPEDLIYFEGHFVGDPILPGVVQLDALVLPEAERCWPGLPQLREVTKLKFKRPIRPGEQLDLELTRLAARGRIEFTLRHGAEICCQGTLHYGGAA